MLTLLENVMLPMDLCGLYSARKSRERAMELLRLVEIDEHAKKLPAFISGGQQQRVAIARALANDPAILVADEPTGSLDSVTADHIFDVFEKLVAAGKTIVMVTHDSGLTPRFSRHLVIADGEIVSERIKRLTVGEFDEVGPKKADEKQIKKQETNHRQEDQTPVDEDGLQESGPILRAWPKEKKEKKKKDKKDKKDKKKSSKKKSGEKKEKQ
jgi:ABC-type methionine transport system ATPase subunit